MIRPSLGYAQPFASASAVKVWGPCRSPAPTAPPVATLHWRLARRRHLLLRGGTAAALLAVVGPGLLAGLSDDDPAGITTYSILGAKYGYELLWVLALSTAALIVFHELGVRLGIVTGKGLLTLVRERYGGRAAGARARGAGDRQHRHALRRVRRGGRRDGTARRHEPLRQRAARGGRRLGAGPAGELPPRRALAARAQLGLRRLRDLRRARPPRLGRRRQGPGRAEPAAQPRGACWSPWRRSARRWRRGGWPSSSPTRSTRGCTSRTSATSAST